MAAGYIFGGDGLPKSQSELRRLRAAAEAMAPRRAPSNVGEGLSFFGQAIASALMDRNADKAEKEASGFNAGMQRSALENYLGEMGPGDPYASALQSPAAAEAPAPTPGTMANARTADRGSVQGYAGMDLKSGIASTAEALGINPIDLATAISYETAGTFDPAKKGPTTQWGQHRGLIQFGEPQAQKYGVNWDDPLGSQLGPEGAVAKYLRDTGVKPGMGMLDIYSAINAGGVGRYNASDANNGGAPGTVRDKVEQQMAGHRAKALALFGGEQGMAPLAMAPQPQMPPEMAAVNAMAGAQPSPAPAPMPPQMPPQQPMQAPPRPISTAGMNYDPATGRVGPGAALNEGATAMPAAAAAFGGAPMAGMRPQAPAPMQGAPAGQPMQPPGISPLPPGRQGDQSTRAMIIDMLTNPAASDETRSMGQMLLQRELAKNAPVQPIEINGQLVDPRTGKVVGDYRTPEATKEGYTTLTREERTALGIPETDTRVYQRGPGGQISAVGGAGQTINIGNEIEQRRAAAAAVGFKEDDPRYQAFILTGDMPREGQQVLTSIDKQAIQDSDDAVQAAEGTLSLIDQALQLNDKAYEGPMAGTRAQVGAIFGAEGAEETLSLNNLVAEQALSQLRTIFGGAPTEGERQILLDIAGSATQPAAVRKQIYERAKKAVERRRAYHADRAETLRGGTYYQPPGAQQPGQAPSAPTAPAAAPPAQGQKVKRYNPATGQFEDVQ